jgi:lysophospholipase L1-like esterase
LQKTIAANALIKTYLATDSKAVFVDIFTKMLDKNGKMRPELFVGDMLHMNPDGYAIWNKAVKKYLIKE